MRTFLILFLLTLHTTLYAQTISSGPLSGAIKGTTLPNKTYIITDSILVNPADSLHVSAGDTIIMQSVNGAMFAFGKFYFDGTSTNPIVVTVPANRRNLGPGQWGGIVADSCGILSIKFTKIYGAGGTNLAGHAYRTIDVTADYQNLQQTIFTDNLINGTVDDAIGVHGGTCSILRNVCKYCGAPDGDNINIKSGTYGEIAYNIVWAAGGSAIKINADTKGLTRLTNICVHNNTCVACGWRRTGETGYGILVDASARAEIYNNIFGDNNQDIEITTAADTLRVHCDNNFLFGSADSLDQMIDFYAPDGVARQQANDKYMAGQTKGYPFVRYKPWFANDFNSLDSNNDYHIVALYANKGFTPPVSWTNPAFAGQLPGDVNVGALATSTTGVNNTVVNEPTGFVLKQNYPNPFNPSTTIQYALPHEGSVTLTVFNLIGQSVRTLVNEVQGAGLHTVRFDASNLPSGVYLYKLQSGGMTNVGRMLLLK